MNPQDLRQVAIIEKENFSCPWSETAFASTLEKENIIYLVAVELEEIIGYCGEWYVLDEGEITNVAVSRSSRRKGIAVQLLQELFVQAQKKGVTLHTLEVRKSNQSAINLYEKLGFQAEGIRKNFYEKPTEDAIIMWKRK
jgi:ribosomal-protein-alanine acetyltransferase